MTDAKTATAPTVPPTIAPMLVLPLSSPCSLCGVSVVGRDFEVESGGTVLNTV